MGFFRLEPPLASSLAELCGRYVADGRAHAPHEEALRDLALSGDFAIGVEDITGLPWIEIDFADDITRANQEILPQLAPA